MSHNQSLEQLKQHPEPVAWALTARQRQVLECLSWGHTNKEIARALGVSPSTVKVHLQAAYQTLRVQSRVAAAVAFANYKARFHLEPDCQGPADQTRVFERL
jgi:DNA-binding NarL/FixJ family response regulator